MAKKLMVLSFFLLFFNSGIQACDWMTEEYKDSSGNNCGGQTCIGQGRMAASADRDTWSLPSSVEGVSGYNSDCHPSITANGQLMAFCAARQNGPAYDTLHIGNGFNVYTAHWNGTSWDSIHNVGRHINPATYPAISPGGESLYVCKANKLWLSTWEDTGWSNPVQLPYPVNDPNPAVSDGPAAVSFDGHQLYFKSSRSGGYGSGDIWVARITLSGFDSLTNLGNNINTTGMETHPAISPDGQRLYFSDFGGERSCWKFGDCDLYIAHWSGSGWEPAQILPAPVNTDLPCCSAFETSDGRLYLGSEVSEGTYGEEDVWVCDPVAAQSETHFGCDRGARGALVSSRAWTNTAELTGAAFIYDLVEAGSTVYAATAPYGDVFKTTDEGLSWQNTGDIPGESHVYSLLVCQDGSILAGTYPNGKIFRTTNGGTDWNQLAQFPYARAVRRIFQKTDGVMFAGTSPDSNRLGRVWRSIDNGNTWQRTANIPEIAGGLFCFTEVPSGAIIAGGRTYGDKYYVSFNNGNSWLMQNLPYADTSITLCHLYFFHRTSDSLIWAGGWGHGPQGILLSSVNNGVSWDTVGQIPNGSMILGRIFDMLEADDGSYFIGFHPGPDSVVFRSTNQGATWHNCGTLNGAYECLCLLKSSSGTIFAGTTPNGDVFKYSSTSVSEDETRPAMNNTQPQIDFIARPNPFSKAVTIEPQVTSLGPSYLTMVKGMLEIRIYDIAGSLVKYLTVPAGRSVLPISIVWNGTDNAGHVVKSGVYFCQLTVPNLIARTKKIILLAD